MLPSWLSSRFLSPQKSVLQATRWACLASVVAASIVQTSVGAAPTGQTFEQLMDVGYAASRQGDFNTALINFRRALELRPNHPYASAAADNMTFYIEHARITRRQHAIDQLEARLMRAIEATDWVCAATTLDQLTMYTAPNSLNRERLVGQRGEVSGLLDARLNHDAWSTVCAAQNPVH
ncbi:MAG: tetratricopeptide repeat protein [Cyanobacteria bacterium J06623_4]